MSTEKFENIISKIKPGILISPNSYCLLDLDNTIDDGHSENLIEVSRHSTLLFLGTTTRPKWGSNIILILLWDSKQCYYIAGQGHELVDIFIIDFTIIDC